MFGSHLSVAGGMTNALADADRLTFDTVQVFTKNQRQWRAPALKDDEVRAWREGLARLGWDKPGDCGQRADGAPIVGRTVSHNSYLVNLASPNDELWEKSVGAQREEIERCEALGIPFLVAHPGAHTGSGEAAGIARIVKAYARLLKETSGYRTIVCIENTVGGGSNLGGPFEQLAAMRAGIAEASPEGAARIGFCMDTCHAFAQGYDVRTASAARLTVVEFDRVCGLGNLRVMHWNDSKGGLASHRDRHEHIGRGEIGLGPSEGGEASGWAHMARHPALARVPKILETPKEPDETGEEWDAVNLRLLRRIAGAPSPTPAPRSAVAMPAPPSPKKSPRAKKAPAKRAARQKTPRAPGKGKGQANRKGR